MAPEELARRIAAALAPLDAVRVGWVFGSQLAGTASPRSDLDVAVAFSVDLPRLARAVREDLNDLRAFAAVAATWLP